MTKSTLELLKIPEGNIFIENITVCGNQHYKELGESIGVKKVRKDGLLCDPRYYCNAVIFQQRDDFKTWAFPDGATMFPSPALFYGTPKKWRESKFHCGTFMFYKPMFDSMLIAHETTHAGVLITNDPFLRKKGMDAFEVACIISGHLAAQILHYVPEINPGGFDYKKQCEVHYDFETKFAQGRI